MTISKSVRQKRRKNSFLYKAIRTIKITMVDRRNNCDFWVIQLPKNKHECLTKETRNSKERVTAMANFVSLIRLLKEDFKNVKYLHQYF